MPYHIENASVRWCKFNSNVETQAHRAPHGWQAEIVLLDSHQIHGGQFDLKQYWIKETKKKEG